MPVCSVLVHFSLSNTCWGCVLMGEGGWIGEGCEAEGNDMFYLAKRW